MIRPFRGIHPQIHPTAFVEESAQIVGDVHIGAHSSVWFGAVVRGDVFHIRIGDRTNIQDNCAVHVTQAKWPTVLEDEVTLGHGAIVHGAVVRKGALIGIRATVLDGAEVGESAFIGAGALVTPRTFVPPRTMWLGAPARLARTLSDEAPASPLVTRTMNTPDGPMTSRCRGDAGGG